jgi:hypothetical protein
VKILDLVGWILSVPFARGGPRKTRARRSLTLTAVGCGLMACLAGMMGSATAIVRFLEPMDGDPYDTPAGQPSAPATFRGKVVPADSISPNNESGARANYLDTGAVASDRLRVGAAIKGNPGLCIDLKGIVRAGRLALRTHVTWSGPLFDLD